MNFMHSTFNRSWLILGGSVLLLGLLVWPLARRFDGGRAAGKAGGLVVYCAAGIQTPVEAIARQYERECGVPVRLQYGGSQTLLANLAVARRGDLYLPGDDGYLRLAREKKLVAETIPLARMSATVAVRKDNLKNITSYDDIFNDNIRISQANPEATAIGQLTREALEKSGRWPGLKARTQVFKPTVNDVASDVKIGAADAGIVWDVTVAQNPDLRPVTAPALAAVKAQVAVGVLRCCEQPAAALAFARYLAARDKGGVAFARAGYAVPEGDVWAIQPELVLYSGAMNRVAVEDTVRRFELREGARVTRVYNGCGILVAQMKAGGRPDAYLTCDQSFVPPVADLFPEAPVEISDAAIVILARKGNPRGLKSLADLAQAGLRVGVANPEQSTLGALTRRLLDQGGILDAVMARVATQTPTADLLVNQMRTGALDAAVVYVSNTTEVRDQLEIIPLNVPGAVAVQTFSVGGNSTHKQLAERLLEALQTEASRARYETLGFHWRGGGATNR